MHTTEDAGLARHARAAHALGLAETYGASGPVEVRETHISYVFLVGDRAYKLKKPLTLSFVDYGSHERRRAACEAEVRLGRRLAPSIYLGVRAVVDTPDGMVLAAPEDARAVEHVVEMRRFDGSDTLAARLDAGTVDGALLGRIGEAIGSFHARAACADQAIDPDGRAALESTLTDLVALGDDRQRQLAEALRDFTTTFVAAERGLLQARRGFVVDGHGDLRAEHVVVGESIEVVDCVEFDPALRVRDGASDLAFLLMDLEAHGHGDARDALLAGYEEAGADAGPERLLTLYELERATMRAKVALVRAAQLGEGDAADAARREADALLELARRLVWRARRPLLIVLCGLAGSGKTYLGNAIAEQSGILLLGADFVRKELAGLDPEERAAPEHYARSFNRLTYQELARRARAELAAGGGVLVHATFRNREDRAAFAQTLGRDVPQPLFVRCDAPFEVLRERVAAGERGASDADVEVLERQRFEPLDEVPADRKLALQTDRPVEQTIAELERWLNRRFADAGIAR